MNIHVNDSRQLRTHTYVLWHGLIVVVAHRLFSIQTAMSKKIHMQMKPFSTHHALSIQLNDKPNLAKIMFSSIGDTTYSRFRVAGPLQIFLFESEMLATQPL